MKYWFYKSNNMQERLQEILTNERLTPARFAELVGVQRSSVSHILSGRNKPSLDFLQKTLVNFEHINPDWLISGKGPYKRAKSPEAPRGTPPSTNRAVSGRIDFPVSRSAKDEDRASYGNIPPGGNQTGATSRGVPGKGAPMEKDAATRDDSSEKRGDNLNGLPKKEVIKTILFYDDHTFDVFFPA